MKLKESVMMKMFEISSHHSSPQGETMVSETPDFTNTDSLRSHKHVVPPYDQTKEKSLKQKQKK